MNLVLASRFRENKNSKLSNDVGQIIGTFSVRKVKEFELLSTSKESFTLVVTVVTNTFAIQNQQNIFHLQVTLIRF